MEAPKLSLASEALTQMLGLVAVEALSWSRRSCLGVQGRAGWPGWPGCRRMTPKSHDLHRKTAILGCRKGHQAKIVQIWGNLAKIELLENAKISTNLKPE